MPEATKRMPLVVSELQHAYGPTPVLGGLSFAVETGEFVAVLGASGCGKSTLLRAVAGLVTPTGGRIDIGGRTAVSAGVEQLPIEQRRVGLVFQDYALFPAMSVADNIGFGLGRNPGAPGRERVQELLQLIGMPEFAERRPNTLSGGQQQRVALARALAPKPALLLLDEPFANVDAARREELGRELRSIVASEGAAALLVTHDRSDALGISDRVLVLAPGERGSRIAQSGTPEDVYRRPSDEVVAGLTGSVFVVEGEAEGLEASTALGRAKLTAARSGSVRLLLRPEQMRFLPDGEGRSRVVERRYLGYATRLRVETPAGVVEVDTKATIEVGRVGNVVIVEDVWGL